MPKLREPRSLLPTCCTSLWVSPPHLCLELSLSCCWPRKPRVKRSPASVAGTNRLSNLGRSLDVVPDFDGDGDGVPDVVVGNPALVLSGPVTARVVAYSGATDLLLFEFVLMPPRFSFASELAVGDFNGDGVPDLAVSSPSTNAPFLQSGKLEMFER